MSDLKYSSGGRPFWKKKRLMIPLSALSLVLFAYFLLWFSYGPYKWNQKLSVTIDTPNGEKSGFSVAIIGWRKNDPLGSTNGPDWIGSVKGEAAVIDLQYDKYLFALLGNANAVAIATILERELGVPNKSGLRKIQRSVDSDYELPRKAYPLLVTFDDINDPASVKEVNPSDLAATFGEGLQPEVDHTGNH